MKLKIKITTLCVALLTAISACALTGCADDGEQQQQENSTVTDTEKDTQTTNPPDTDDEDIVDDVIDELPYVKDDWNFYTFNYSDSTGAEATMDYALYIPSSYDGTEAYPLLTYIPDARYIHSKLTTIAQAEGPASWLNEEKQQEHPVIWLIMQISNSTGDVEIEGSQAAQIVPIIDKVIEDWNIDENRLYLTGHSMGCIMFFSVNDTYPDKFAATFYVSGGLGNADGDELYNRVLSDAHFTHQKFVFMTSGGVDGEMLGTYKVITDTLEAQGIEYGKDYNIDYYGDEVEEQVQTVLDLGYDQNLLAFITTTKDSNQSEHVSSFGPAYTVDAIYDWLLQQTKADTENA